MRRSVLYNAACAKLTPAITTQLPLQPRSTARHTLQAARHAVPLPLPQLPATHVRQQHQTHL